MSKQKSNISITKLEFAMIIANFNLEDSGRLCQGSCELFQQGSFFMFLTKKQIVKSETSRQSYVNNQKNNQ